ncbi:potassium channel family protein [Sabulicella rubraurantiaca]|uniref:potassium channel family protein n=1 Tax=Sabulicella rubraurantiaca TaxID=2811429 RepID=UPI001A96D805|nr:potassium channel family protein [Sabulicella rubraurantiaca]
MGGPLSSLYAALACLIGCALLFLAAYEVYATVLHARARAGPLAETLSRLAWRVALAATGRLPRERRHRALNRVGPLLLPTLLAALMGVLSLGFACIYLPWMPDGFRVDEGAQDAPAWLQAIYFSGVTVTTLGYGDIVPRVTLMRLVALAEAGTGFVAIPLTVAYFLTVNGALERRRAAALALFHEAGRGPDAAAALLARRHRNGEFVGLDDVFAEAARALQAVLESQVEHPVTQYFHPVEVHDGLPRMLFVALEIGAVLRAFPDPDRYPEACDHPTLTALEETALHALGEVAVSIGLRRRASPARTVNVERNDLADRIARTRARLAKAGIAERPDAAVAIRAYLEHRSRWEGDLKIVASSLGYDWDELTGDQDPRAAAEADRMREDA